MSLNGVARTSNPSFSSSSASPSPPHLLLILSLHLRKAAELTTNTLDTISCFFLYHILFGSLNSQQCPLNLRPQKIKSEAVRQRAPVQQRVLPKRPFLYSIDPERRSQIQLNSMEISPSNRTLRQSESPKRLPTGQRSWTSSNPPGRSTAHPSGAQAKMDLRMSNMYVLTQLAF